MSRRIRVTGKRRREVDVDKLVVALLRITEADQPSKSKDETPGSANGGTKATDTESAA